MGSTLTGRSKQKRVARITIGGAITDVAGIKVGHFTDARRPTGCTVVLAEEGATGGVDVRGAAPGTRETDLLDPVNTVELVHAVMLSGGSAFGLEAAAGAVRYLEEKSIGYDMGVARVPIVTSAILFDLWIGDARVRPDAEAGYKACKSASTQPPAEGNAGAGAGATIGKLFGRDRAMKGGIGTAAVKVDGITVGALVAVNAIGDVLDPHTGDVIAGARTKDGKALLDTSQAILRGELPPAPAPETRPGASTTRGVVATDANLTKAQANKVAQMAHDGLARAISPVHTPLDGDAIFALATGKARKSASVMLIGSLAAEVTAAAIMRAARAAKGLPGLPSAADLLTRG
ncbi:MAG TPA: P1 family peptidase [Blastocatellia bacterium]|nr:P1 family peptidase [Blastocatellia bacterium]